MPGAAVVIDQVSKLYEGGAVTALAEVSLRLDPGEVLALSGPSGCGKSTLLNLVGALDRPDRGEVYVDGKRLSDLSAPSLYRRQTVGFVFQSHHLDDAHAVGREHDRLVLLVPAHAVPLMTRPSDDLENQAVTCGLAVDSADRP